MTVQRGVLARVEIYDTKVLGMVKWIYNGIQRRIFDISEFQDDVDVFEYGGCEAGAISIQGMYDPSDTTGQNVLNQVFDDCVKLHEGQMKFHVGENDYFTVDSDGHIQILLFDKIESSRETVSLVEMGLMVSGGFFIRMTRNPLKWDEYILWEPGISWDQQNYIYA